MRSSASGGQARAFSSAMEDFVGQSSHRRKQSGSSSSASLAAKFFPIAAPCASNDRTRDKSALDARGWSNPGYVPK